jgi:hypothetical protein
MQERNVKVISSLRYFGNDISFAMGLQYMERECQLTNVNINKKTGR